MFWLKVKKNFLSKVLTRTMVSTVNYKPQMIKDIFPKLDHSRYKGQNGKIGVVGGSQEYTGAPYFAGMSALRFGADLVHIFCSQSAATPIKCYSPELIVHPMESDPLKADQVLEQWFERLHTVLIGPGLGRSEQAVRLVNSIAQKGLGGKPLIIDADGLFMVSENPLLLVGAKNVTLTPNQVEYRRLCTAIANLGTTKTGMDNPELMLTEFFGSEVTLVKKGQSDVIFNKHGKIEVDINGGLCRCGGQGDVLSGSIALFTHWAQEAKHENPALFGAYAGCYVTKKLSEKVFNEMGRSMVAGDMISAIPSFLKESFY
ncbi:ATP-dependent (S)-NAD(P)H-hydrate dehydratase-like [Clytia hemisphaerica]|uniref:ATP-dependent (S)-NAD(P)H-hydrate dehydratase n=1 Tax=Clytia hemisphaerica TaxID=252671 RepID=A0A7M5WTQ2_9CNID